MKIVADLHLHSHYSRATSKNLTFEHLHRWAQLKGVYVVGTGDIAHPGWLQEMREKLEPAEEGLYRLKDEFAAAVQATVPAACRAIVRFMLGGEISNIYKKGGKTRKVHNVIFAPDLVAVAALQERLGKIGNIRADGRPILGLDSRDLFETVLEVDARCQLIPAHIWTPWFSLLGSKSGFDSVEECFEDLTPHIAAVETGLSSDPPMNWRVSQLDRFTLVSNSDAHSPEKLAREATLFDTELSYGAMFEALRTGDPQAFSGTVEFFPEEGKYHLDGHRACGIVWDPPTTIAHGRICPVCGKEVTVGVMHRVEELADRPLGAPPSRPHEYFSLIPLPEIIGEALGVGSGSGRVEQEMAKLLARLGPELFILRDAPLPDIAAVGGERLAEGIGRMRRGEVDAQGGYDGEYGVVRLFSKGGQAVTSSVQAGLFDQEGATDTVSGRLEQNGSAGMEVASRHTRSTDQGQIQETHDAYETQTTSLFHLDGAPPMAADGYASAAGEELLSGLNEQQQAAVRCTSRSLIISAGPGTGKTRTLTHRIAYLVLALGVSPESILAITFTNKAAGEMVERLEALLGEQARRLTVQTFHAFAAGLLREHGARVGIDPHFVICSEPDRLALLRDAAPELSQAQLQRALGAISDAKNRLRSPSDLPGDLADFAPIYAAYERCLASSGALDFDDLIFKSVKLLASQGDVLHGLHERYRWISVDEYQDVNPAQVRFLELLAQGGANLCVIGDPDQAIYGFRGADRNYFLSFLQEHPQAVALQLTENYRSTQMILDAAGQVISREDGSSSPQVTPSSQRTLRAAQALAQFAEQVRLDVYAAPTDRAEAEYVVHQIEQMVGGTSYFSLDSGRAPGDAPSVARSFSDFAVLYRLSAQSRLLIEAFDRSGIPYQTVAETPLTAHRDVRQVLALLWLLHNPRSRLHLLAVLSDGKRAMSGDVADRILSGMDAQGAATTSLAAALANAGEGLPPRQQSRLHALSRLFGALQGAGSVAEKVELAWQFVLVDREGEDAPQVSATPRERLLRLAAPFEARLSDFLQAVALGSETDAYDPRADRVALMTLHAAKGLEFPVVFIVGCEEWLLPYVRQGEAPDVDEERRLFYVGMTRAQQKLVLCHARRRVLFGQQMQNAPSRFVNDIEAALKALRESEGRRKPKDEPGQLSLF